MEVENGPLEDHFPRQTGGGFPLRTVRFRECNNSTSTQEPLVLRSLGLGTYPPTLSRLSAPASATPAPSPGRRRCLRMARAAPTPAASKTPTASTTNTTPAGQVALA